MAENSTPEFTIEAADDLLIAACENPETAQFVVDPGESDEQPDAVSNDGSGWVMVKAIVHIQRTKSA